MGENARFKIGRARVETIVGIGRQRVLNTHVPKNAFKHAFVVQFGNRLCIGVRAKNASVFARFSLKI